MGSFVSTSPQAAEPPEGPDPAAERGPLAAPARAVDEYHFYVVYHTTL
jgi:hypothetical protein